MSLLPEIQDVLRALNSTLEEFKEKLIELTAMFPDLIARWKAEMDTWFTALAVDAGFRGDNPPLTLAAAVFRCGGVRQHYPNILAHMCGGISLDDMKAEPGRPYTGLEQLLSGPTGNGMYRK